MSHWRRRRSVQLSSQIVDCATLGTFLDVTVHIMAPNQVTPLCVARKYAESHWNTPDNLWGGLPIKCDIINVKSSPVHQRVLKTCTCRCSSWGPYIYPSTHTFISLHTLTVLQCTTAFFLGLGLEIWLVLFRFLGSILMTFEMQHLSWCYCTHENISTPWI